MNNPSSSPSNKFGIARSIGIAFCVLGILAGILLMNFGSDTFDFAASNDADIRGPFGILAGFGGLLVFLVPALGLIALVGSRFAKSRIARGFIKLLGAGVALVLIGAISLILIVYLNLRPALQLWDEADAQRLIDAEQGDMYAQLSVGDDFYREWEDLSYGSDPVFCPEALHWYRQAAFQDLSLGMHHVVLAYGNCAPGNNENNQILAMVWGNLADDVEGAASSMYSSVRMRHFQNSGIPDVDRLDPNQLADALATVDAITVRARAIFSDPGMSASNRQVAMDNAARELLPRANGNDPLAP